MKFWILSLASLAVILVGCARTQVVESPKTAIVLGSGAPKDPEVVWTGRTLKRDFGYLGQIKVRSWTWDGAITRLLEGGRSLNADAIVDIYYQKTGFMTEMQALAIQYR